MDTTSKTYSRRTQILLGDRRSSLFNRLIAKAIDLLVLFTILLLGGALWAPLGPLGACLYSVVQDSLGIGQSVGKRIVGLRVVDEHTGLHCSLFGSFVRNLPLGIASLLFPFSLFWMFFVGVLAPIAVLEGYLMNALPTGNRLGDVLGNTVVIDYLESV